MKESDLNPTLLSANGFGRHADVGGPVVEPGVPQRRRRSARVRIAELTGSIANREPIKIDKTVISSEEATSSAPELLQTFELDYRNDPRWDAFVSWHPDGLIYHHSSWLIALEEEYGQKCVSLACADSGGQIRAVLPLFPTRGLPFAIGRYSTRRRLSSLPRTPVAGVLADDPASGAEIIRAAMALARARRVQLEIKTQIAGLDRRIAGLGCVPWRFTYVEELPSSTEGTGWDQFCENLRLPRDCGSCKQCRRLRFGNAKQQHRVNWAVNKAAKLGLEVREAESAEDLEQWYGLYLQTMRHKAVPPRPYRFFQSLWSTLRPRGQMRLLLAERRHDGRTRLIAGSIFLKFGQSVFYAFTGCDPRDLGLHPHDIIQLEAIRDACKGGYRWYDFGEVSSDNQSLAQFKGKWGTQPRPLFRYYDPARQERPGSSGIIADSARKLWISLPERVTAILGDLIYRYL